MKITIEIPDTADVSAISDDEVESIIKRALSFTQDRDDGSQVDLPEASVTVVSSAWTARPSRSFGAWLKTQVGRDDIVGDLAKDAAGDKRASSGRATKAQWRDHIVNAVGADTGAIAALNEAWAEFMNA